MWPKAMVIVLFAGCGAASGSASSEQPLECGAVISSLLARSETFAKQVWGDRQPIPSQQLDAMIDRIKPPFVQSCRDDHWSEELLRCMDEMKVTDDPHKCNHLFTEDQMVALARRFMAVMSPR